MAGVIVGVLIMGIAENVMNLLNIQAFYRYVVRGLILLLAVLSDNLRSAAIGFSPMRMVCFRHGDR
jgi:L-arabinose transport system permease protein